MEPLHTIQHVISEDELSTNQRQYGYASRTDGQPVYIGIGRQGAGDGEASWLIRKYTYDADGFITKEQTTVNSTWTDRATATYT